MSERRQGHAASMCHRKEEDQAAWICEIAFCRRLVDQKAFTKTPFGQGTIQALKAPNRRVTELRHRGLFAWLSSDAPRLLRRQQDAGVLLVVWQQRKVQRDEDDWILPDPACQDGELDSDNDGSDGEKGELEDVVMEAYEMRCSRWGGEGYQGAEMRAETTGILRVMSEYMLMLDTLDGGFRVDIEVFQGEADEREAKEKLSDLRTFECGSLRIRECEIACAILVSKDA